MFIVNSQIFRVQSSICAASGKTITTTTTTTTTTSTIIIMSVRHMIWRYGIRITTKGSERVW